MPKSPELSATTQSSISPEINSNDTPKKINIQNEDASTSNISPICSKPKSSEDEEIEFLNRVHKEQISNEIRERKQEKKLLRNNEKSNNQDTLSYNKDKSSEQSNSSCVVKTVTVETEVSEETKKDNHNGVTTGNKNPNISEIKFSCPESKSSNNIPYNQKVEQ
ncbi:hypothetical protein Glove_166g150 [Diversispora epigaea]|uniref:Uncharacterized protein n=1 Tax=Diversispora epigaea TaxID=1348612 RepID=A0A397IZA3_9GLOM|nr:hypothetical protein Glove_166g150 [Diversispora epigaea]